MYYLLHVISIIYPELIFEYGLASFLLCMCLSNWPNIICWRDSHCHTMLPLSKVLFPRSVSLHESMCLLLCQCHAASVVVPLLKVLISRRAGPSTLFSSVKGVEAVLGTFYAHINVRVKSSVAIHMHTVLLGFTLRLLRFTNHFGILWYFYDTESPMPQTSYILLFIYVFLNSSSQYCLIIFYVKALLILC